MYKLKQKTSAIYNIYVKKSICKQVEEEIKKEIKNKLEDN